MASPLAKKWRTIVFMVVVVAGLWGWILIKGFTPNLGLDLQGGISVVLAPSEGQQVDDRALEEAVNIIRNRVDALGVAEPDISRQGENVLVQIPGVEDQERALELIGSTARLRFRPVLEAVAPPPEDATEEQTEGVPVCGDRQSYPEDDPEAEIVVCVPNDGPPQGWPLLKVGPAAVEGSDVRTAQAVIDPAFGPGWFVSLDLTREGGDKFADITGKLACNRGTPPTDQLAIVLDREVVSAPQMGEGVQCNVGITGGSAQITGDFTQEEARDLELKLRYGALPVELEPQAVTTVTPTLGRESLRSGLIAALLGVIIVFLYILIFYRGLGLVVWLGISVHAAFTYAVVILLGQAAGFALSLAGIAGLIVSLGVAADSFIVYFERIKDEVLAGRAARAASERAWASARRTILAADTVTALAAVVLYFLAVGGVRGFALMLGLATALDIFVSFWFMHPVVWILTNTRVLGTSKTLGLRGAAPAPVAGGQR